MDWITGLQHSLDYMEEHLTEELDYAEIARQAYTSSFHFQRIFAILCGCTVGEYIRNRRLTLAGSELASTRQKVIDVALKYGYESPESFCRAFVKFHGITPSQAKSDGAGLKSFSPLSVKLIIQGGTIMDYRIEKREPLSMLVKKARLNGGGEVTKQAISGFWQQVTCDGTIGRLCKHRKSDKDFDNMVVGICFTDPDAGNFDYGIGVPCENGAAEEGFTVEEIPAATWAVFSGCGPMPDAFPELWKRIYTEFFPASDYEPDGICFEVYPDADVSREDYTFEIWNRVKKK